MIQFIRDIQNRQIHKDDRYISDCSGAWGGAVGTGVWLLLVQVFIYLFVYFWLYWVFIADQAFL